MKARSRGALVTISCPSVAKCLVDGHRYSLDASALSVFVRTAVAIAFVLTMLLYARRGWTLEAAFTDAAHVGALCGVITGVLTRGSLRAALRACAQFAALAVAVWAVFAYLEM